MVTLLATGCPKAKTGVLPDPPTMAPIGVTPDILALVPEVESGTVGILLLGSDKRSYVAGERADAIMYALISPQKKRMTLLSFPRDSYVAIPGHGRNRINASLTFGGPELTVRTVSDFLGLPIDYYMLAEFWSYKRVVDAIGTIPVDLERRINDSGAKIDLPAGYNELNGPNALGLARARKAVKGGDFGRAANQQLMVQGAHGKYLDGNDGTDLGYIVSLMKDNLRTDLPVTEALRVAKGLRRIPAENVEAIVLPGSVGYAGRASVVFPIESQIRTIVDRIKTEHGLD